MVRLVVLGLFFFGLFVRAEEVEPLPRPHVKNPLGLNGWLATALANRRPLNTERYADREIEITLADGTRVGGLALWRDERAPLLICTFGFLGDRWSGASGQFIRRFVEEGLVHAHVLVLDHPSSFAFWVRNGHLSFGGYDEGRMLLEVAGRLRARGDASRVTTIHLLGVSMGGLGVIHALAEDSRLSLGLLSSGITFSAVTDPSVVPVYQLSHYGRKGDGAGPWGKKIRSGRRWAQKRGLDFLFRRFRKMADRQGVAVDVRKRDAGQFFRDAFERRLAFLRRSAESDDLPWNPAIALDRLETYVASCDATDHIREVRVPLVMVHAYDDPVVPYEQLQRVEFVGDEGGNPHLTTLGVQQGGHWGFATVYRKSWVAKLVNLTLQPG